MIRTVLVHCRWRSWELWTLCLIFLWGCAASERDLNAQSPEAARRPTNRLARETSPYLRQHAHNPVDWHPWGPEAFEIARRENRPIFLSIGYSSCYWCHVMERNVFSNPEIARYMNEHFVNIKVDREERPDLDEIYMTALTVYFRAIGSSQSAGWPVSLFLTPTGKPLGGGTYFPPADDEERDGFPTLMKRVVEGWASQREEMERNADFLARTVQQGLQPRLLLNGGTIDPELVRLASNSLTETFDPEFGGFDFDPARPEKAKFPLPCKVALLQYAAGRQGNTDAERMVTLVLHRMADGGIHDQLGGGFHRYSTDRRWSIPHFEKMLYDNAQLADVYIEAFVETQDPRYREVADGIFSFVLRDLADPAGGFYSSLDAESEGVEGKYYVWSRAEIEKILSPDELQICTIVYGLDRAPNFDGKYVIEVVSPPREAAAQLNLTPAAVEQQLRSIQGKLLAVRNRRKPPRRDDKVLAGWNGLMIRALANGGTVLNRPAYVQAAERAALFVLAHMRDSEGRLLRSYCAREARQPAFLNDYAYLVDGLLALHQATGDEKWLNAARRLTDSQLELFWDDQRKGCFFTGDDQEELMVRTKTLHDSVLPSGNSVTVRNLLRLASLCEAPEYRDRARETLEASAPLLKNAPRSMATMALAMGEYLDDPDFAAGRLQRPDAPLEAKAAPEIQLVANQAPQKKPKEPVQARVYLSVDRLPAGGSCQFLVHVLIDEPWHINANPATDEFAVPTVVTVKSRRKTTLAGIRYAPPQELEVPGQEKPLLIYTRQAIIRGLLEVPAAAAGGEEELEFQIQYQACNDETCLRPQTIKLRVPIAVARPGEPVRPINPKLFPPSRPRN